MGRVCGAFFVLRSGRSVPWHGRRARNRRRSSPSRLVPGISRSGCMRAACGPARAPSRRRGSPSRYRSTNWRCPASRSNPWCPTSRPRRRRPRARQRPQKSPTRPQRRALRRRRRPKRSPAPTRRSSASSGCVRSQNFSRRATVVALAVAGTASERRRLDSLSSRARSSALLPEAAATCGAQHRSGLALGADHGRSVSRHASRRRRHDLGR